MELPKRKSIRLPQHDYSLSNRFYVTICTFDRAPLFGELVGAHLCVRPQTLASICARRLAELEKKYTHLRIEKFVFMPDHLHLILFNPGEAQTQTGAHTGAPLPEIIKWFKAQTTNDYIKAVKAGILPSFDRHIWQRGYYEHIIRDERDYAEIWNYIENNPHTDRE